MKITAAKPKKNKKTIRKSVNNPGRQFCFVTFVCFKKKVKRGKVKNNNRDTSINQVYTFFL